nr:b-box zinc finger protein 21 [Quercus suber]
MSRIYCFLWKDKLWRFRCVLHMERERGCQWLFIDGEGRGQSNNIRGGVYVVIGNPMWMFEERIGEVWRSEESRKHQLHCKAQEGGEEEKMKIRCDVCEKVEAEVLCCADEAVLCREFDGKVHAANKLSQKHERVLLKRPSSSSSFSSSSVQFPPCDLCQHQLHCKAQEGGEEEKMKIRCDVCEKVEAEVLCCADEAVLCREFDGKVHAANKLSQKHERVLLKRPSSSSSFSSSSVQFPPCDLCQVCILWPSGRFQFQRYYINLCMLPYYYQAIHALHRKSKAKECLQFDAPRIYCQLTFV